MGAQVMMGNRASDAYGGSCDRDIGRGSTKIAGVRDKGPGARGAFLLLVVDGTNV